MEIVIDSVDYAPEDLYGQTPLRGRLLRKIAGQDRPDYWVAELNAPLSWTTDGSTRSIRHLVLAAHWQGTSIRPGATLPVAIAYVTDDSLLTSEFFEFRQTEYVAIGMAKISRAPSLWSRLWTRLRSGLRS